MYVLCNGFVGSHGEGKGTPFTDPSHRSFFLMHADFLSRLQTCTRYLGQSMHRKGPMTNTNFTFLGFCHISFPISRDLRFGTTARKKEGKKEKDVCVRGVGLGPWPQMIHADYYCRVQTMHEPSTKVPRAPEGSVRVSCITCLKRITRAIW